MNIPVEEMAKYCCALMDIPVHKINKDRNLVESLHVLFTLYSGFKTNQHF
jgi:intraflagellar transport protein 46